MIRSSSLRDLRFDRPTATSARDSLHAQEYAAEARRIVDEGGVHIHIHARTPDGAPSTRSRTSPRSTTAIRAEIGDAAILNFSTGTIGVSVEKRAAYLRACPPEVGALKHGLDELREVLPRGASSSSSRWSSRTPSTRSSSCWRSSSELRSSPSTSASTSATSARSRPLVDMGVLETPLHADFVMGVVGGIPPTARNLAAMADNLAAIPGGPHHWGVIGTRASSGCSSPLRLSLGGSIRVGLETTSTCLRARWRRPTAS